MSESKSKISTLDKQRKRGRPKGQPKSGGRSKGTPNKRSVVLHKILAESGVDIGKEIKKAFEVATPEGKIQLIRILLDHFPKPVAIEMDDGDDEKTVVVLTNAQKAAKLASI